MEEHSLRQQHEVVKVPISDSQQVRHHATSGAAAREVVEGLALHAERAAGVGVVVSQELQHAVRVKRFFVKNTMSVASASAQSLGGCVAGLQRKTPTRIK